MFSVSTLLLGRELVDRVFPVGASDVPVVTYLGKWRSGRRGGPGPLRSPSCHSPRPPRLLSRSPRLSFSSKVSEEGDDE